MTRQADRSTGAVVRYAGVVTLFVRLARYEARLWRALFLLATGRRHGVRPGLTGFGYARPLTAVWLPLTGVCAVELAAVHLLVPWPTARWVLLVLSLWGLVVVAGAWASYIVRPYLVDACGVLLRLGHGHDLFVPWAEVAAVAVRTVFTWPAPAMASPIVLRHRRALVYLVGPSTRLVLTLSEPMTAPDGGEVDEIHLSIDDPDAFLAAASALRVPAGPS